MYPKSINMTQYECDQGNSSFRWGGIGGERLYFNATARGWEVGWGAVWVDGGAVWLRDGVTCDWMG